MMPKQAPAFWHNDSWPGVVLLPLGWVFAACVRLRRFLYHTNILKQQRLSVPVIIVGNITVGGTGKTPLVIYIARLLKQAGFKPGIISRGYGGNAASQPQSVTAHSHVQQVGDEALLIASQSDCPMTVGALRVDAARLLLAQNDCDVILSDDGLQHYALARDIEIAVIDGGRRFGNGYCLPAGPLREPVARLQQVDMIVVNGEKTDAREFSMQLAGTVAVNISSGESRPLSTFTGIACHALAGIGNPERFFTSLAAAGLVCESHYFPDHHPFSQQDITFLDDKPVLMTEKDAVKCTLFASHQHWYVPVKALLNADFSEQLLHLLKTKYDR
ncbi:lipid A 4'kinase [Crenothrix polyspora]|uniref:Tetraacyldisaccharide 4'-kinase n=1 Tax=Crenothrix polyspora TaxID=360316 RepID=A0A1R4H1P5_9GAMM|nr:tetraacyldisaccharide 4'-kinase [Crenothrix polyspora]SJM90174.1 lipid A 4'kinase [Crenothrix polyspora]